MAKQPTLFPEANPNTKNIVAASRRNNTVKVTHNHKQRTRRLASLGARKRRAHPVLSFLSKAIRIIRRFNSAFIRHIVLPCLRQLQNSGQQTARPQNIENDRTSQSDTQVHSVVYDARGRERLRLSHRTQDYQEGQDGNMVTREEFENLQLTNGQIWNFAQMARPGKDAVHVSQCFMCQSGAYTPTSLIRTCYRCGRAACPQHFSRCSDGHFRCKQCNLTYRVVHDGLKRIFLKKVN